jgi:hypothetical protein
MSRTEPLDPAVVAGEFGQRKDYERESAAIAINKLARTLETMLTAIAEGNAPHASIGGDIGVVGEALEVQRRVDAWIFNARAEVAVASCTTS